MSITITEKDVGRAVKMNDGSIRKIERFDGSLIPVFLGNSDFDQDWFHANGKFGSGYFIASFAEEPACPALTVDRVREIVREMIQPLAEKKEPQRGECWVNVDADGCRSVYDSRKDADNETAHDRIACVKVEWTEGQGLEGESR